MRKQFRLKDNIIIMSSFATTNNEQNAAKVAKNLVGLVFINGENLPLPQNNITVM